MTKTEPLYDVFLSYNRKDKAAVEALARRLANEENLRVWLDQWKLIPGESWQETSEEALSASATCAVFLGPTGLGPWENVEVRAALRIRAARDGFRVIPVLLPGASSPETDTLPLFLSGLTWVDFRSGLENEIEFRHFVAGILGTEPGPPDSQVATSTVTECPYRGLEAFEEKHWDVFFGREEVIQKIIDSLLANRFNAVIGPSGIGKSSLVQAGVIPALKHGALPDSKDWSYRTLSPGVHPLRALAVSLVKPEAGRDPHEQTVLLLKHLESDRHALDLHVRVCLVSEPKNAFFFLFIDRFEEIITLCQDDKEREQFLLNLQYASTIADGRLITIIAMRGAFVDPGAVYGTLFAMLSGRPIFVAAMDDDDLRRAIEKPAEKAHLRFEKGLVERMLEDVGHEPGLLPLLQDTLTQLFTNRTGNTASLQEYQELGGVRGGLAKRAEEVFARFSPEDQEIVRRVLVTLTHTKEGLEDTRRPAELRELWPDYAHRASVEKVIDILVDSRLLTTSGNQREHRTVEVAHEALIRGWPRLHKWIDEERGERQIQRRITEAAKEWRTRNRDAGFLYRGARLAEALEWRVKNAELMNEMIQEFLESSSGAQRRENRAALMRRWRTAVVSLITLSLIVLAVFLNQKQKALNQKQKAARLRELVGSSMRVKDMDPELSLRLALEAADIDHGKDAERALRLALSGLQKSVVLCGHEGKLFTAAFSRDGKYVVTASGDTTARIWDVQTGMPVLALRGHTKAVYCAAFSPDGKHVVTASEDKTARIWDTQTGESRTLIGHTNEVNSADYTPDGKFIVTTSDDTTARIWDAETVAERQVLRGHTGKVYRVAFNTAGDRVVTASEDKTARIWDMNTGKEVRMLADHRKGVIRVAYSGDGKYVATGSLDNTARIWDAETGASKPPLISQQDPDDNNTINTVAFSPDSKSLLVASSDTTAGIWDVEKGTLEHSLLGHRDSIHRAYYDADGKNVVTASADGTARIFNAQTGQLISVLRGHSGEVWDASFDFDPHGGTRVVTASYDGTARIWNVAAGQSLYQFPKDNIPTNTVPINAVPINTVAYSPNGEYIVTANADHNARIWNAKTGTVFCVLRGHTRGLLDKAGVLYIDEALKGVKSASFSQDGRFVVTASAADNTAIIWDASTGVPLYPLHGNDNHRPPNDENQDGINCAAFSRDGKSVATANRDGKVQIWDGYGNRLFPLIGHTRDVNSVAFSSDGKYLVSASLDNTAIVWDLATQKKLFKPFGRNTEINTAVFSPDGAQVLTANRDKTARMWDAHTGQLLFELRGHGDKVYSAVFSPNGEEVVTSSADKTARVWDAHTGQLLFELHGTLKVVMSAAFSPDGNYIATAGADGIAWVYICDVCVPLSELVEMAVSRHPR